MGQRACIRKTYFKYFLRLLQELAYLSILPLSRCAFGHFEIHFECRENLANTVMKFSRHSSALVVLQVQYSSAQMHHGAFGIPPFRKLVGQIVEIYGDK